MLEFNWMNNLERIVSGILFVFFVAGVQLDSSGQLNQGAALNNTGPIKACSTHSCGGHISQEELIWVTTPPNNTYAKASGSNQVASVLTNVDAYTQSIHNAIAKWDAGSCQSFSFGTTAGGNDIRWGQALSSTAKHTGGHSYEELRRSAAAMGTTFNIGDVFYLSLNAGGALDTAFQLQFAWEDLGNTANVVTIEVETNYGVGGAAAYSASEAIKLMEFYDLINPIIKEIYGPPSRNHIVHVVNDGYAVGVNTYYNGPNQISSNATNYLDVDNDLNQPRLMIHELVHAYRDNVSVSSDSTWHYEPFLSGFEEGMAEGVAIIVMDIFAERYPNFWNGERHKIHWNQARGMPFEWNYDFENHSQITTQDYWSSGQATGSHWIRYGIGATAMKKMYYEDTTVFVKFNEEYYNRLNADHSLLPTRVLMVDIFSTIKTEVERTPIEDWINDQRIFDCTINDGKKVFMLSFTALSWSSFQHDNRIHFMETHQNGLEWNWGSTDPAGTNEVETDATWKWYHQLNNTPGNIDFVRDWDNTSFANRAITNNGHWQTDAGGTYAGQTLSGPHQGANPYKSFDGLIYDAAGPFTRDLMQNQTYSIGTEIGKRAYAIGSQRLYTSTSTTASMWPTLVSQGGNLLDARAELDMNESGLFRFEIGFDDASGSFSDSYYRLLGDSFVDIKGVFGGIYSTLANQVEGRMFIEHEDYGEELELAIFNNTFKSNRLWTSILEPLVQYQGGRSDRKYSVPGQIHGIYVDSTCAQKKIDFRTIGYGDGLRGTEMLLFSVEAMEDILFTQSNDTVINVGDDFNLAVTNNFSDIFSGDSRISYTWLDPNNNPISIDTVHTFTNAAITDTGIYNIEIDFFDCPIFQLPVHVEIDPCATSVVFNVTTTETACDFFLWIDGNTYTSSNNTATHTLTNAANCDSIVTLDLTITNSTSGTATQTACDSFLWIDGNIYSVSNNSATHTLTNAAGCDSVVTLDLIINTVDSSVSQNGIILTADVVGAAYQWLDCDNSFSIISGETNQSFTTTANGNFAVEITLNSCVDTSACYSVTSVGIIENSFGNGLLIYPNPTDGSFSIDLGKTYNAVSITMTDLNGKLIQSKTYSESQLLNLKLEEPAGVYLLIIETRDKKAVIRLVKE